MQLSEQAPAKINLTLRVFGRRADGYHRLESLVVFADLADTLTLSPSGAAALKLTGAFADGCGPAADNLVLKAAAALGVQVEGLKSGRFLLDKCIPVAAGLGGGSTDAAAALRLLARSNDLALDDPRLYAAARATGADVPVCLKAKAQVMRGIGEELSPALDLPPLAAVLAQPSQPLATGAVFAAFDPTHSGQPALGDIPLGREALLSFLARYANDLEPAAISLAPVIADVLGALRSLPGCRLARMSGSGATCFALFDDSGAAEAAVETLRAQRSSWWTSAVRLT